LDVSYLPRGVVMARSLAAACGPDGFRLRVFCFDDESHRVLTALRLPGVVAIPLESLEAHDFGLAAAKANRTQVEYFWTATPAVCRFVLEREPAVEMITYVDADLRFFGDPAPLYREMGTASVLITPHRFPPEWTHWESQGGTYNVQFMAFRRDADGLEALDWWHARCLEWCYDRLEGTRFGDQGYIDEFPARFPAVHELAHVGGGLAPWNARRYRIESGPEGISVDGMPLIFYHYQSLVLHRGPMVLWRLARRGRSFRSHPGLPQLVWSVASYFELPAFERRLLWEPYVDEIVAVARELERDIVGYRMARGRPRPREIARGAARVLTPSALRPAIKKAMRAVVQRTRTDRRAAA
jgi:hypothetical protein